MRYNKTQQAIKKRTGLNCQKNAEFIKAVFHVISEALSNNEKISIPNFGTFSVANRRDFETINKNISNEYFTIYAHKTIHLLTSGALKIKINFDNDNHRRGYRLIAKKIAAAKQKDIDEIIRYSKRGW